MTQLLAHHLISAGSDTPLTHSLDLGGPLQIKIEGQAMTLVCNDKVIASSRQAIIALYDFLCHPEIQAVLDLDIDR